VSCSRRYGLGAVEMQGHGRTADADMQQTYTRPSPHPEHFAEFTAAQARKRRATGRDHRAGVGGPRRPRFRDRRARRADEAAVPGAQLAVIPGATHTTITRRVDLLGPLLAAFLD
jgi:hypothetical protein